VRVLLAEDSAVVREYLVYILSQNPQIEVVGTAKDGIEAVEKAEQLRPNLVLMDAHMPRMNGFEATRKIMEVAPTPIVMISASLEADATAITFEAIKAGALTMVEKPAGPGHPAEAEMVTRLLETVRLMAEVKVVRRWARTERKTPSVPPPRNVRLVVMGASTGGPAALGEIVQLLPPTLQVPILVVQHITPGFTVGLVQWLRRETPLPLKMAEPLEVVRPGTVYLAPEGAHMGITRAGRIHLTKGTPGEGYCPSVNHLFESVALSYGHAAMGVLLTGMGQDGAAGLLKLRQAGGVTIAQDEETSAVFGMPAEAIRLGAAELVLSTRDIAETIKKYVSFR